MKQFVIVLLALFSLLNAHANFLDKLSNTLGNVNKVLGATNGNVPQANFVPATNTQMQKIVNALSQSTNNATLDNIIIQAKPKMAQLLLLGGCSTNIIFETGALQAPSANPNYFVSALAKTYHHPQNQCLTVQNIGSWTQSTKNTISFKVVYSSEISGETVTRVVEMIDEYGNGNWLAKKHDFY